jgi:hypothetical protein
MPTSAAVDATFTIAPRKPPLDSSCFLNCLTAYFAPRNALLVLTRRVSVKFASSASSIDFEGDMSSGKIPALFTILGDYNVSRGF